jgi:hypothetical protein
VTGSHHYRGQLAAFAEFDFDFDFDRPRHAAVTLPSRTDPFAPTRRLLRSVYGADHVRMLTYNFLPEGDPAAGRCFVEAGQPFKEGSDSTLVRSLLAGPASTTHLRELLTRDARIGVVSKPVPVVLAIADEQVVVGAVDDGGGPRGLIVADDGAIRSWAEETVDDLLARAEQLTPGAINARGVGPDVTDRA